MSKEHPAIDFDDIFAAIQRHVTYTYTLTHTNVFDQWIIPPQSGEAYSEISPALWQAVATARLERDEYDLYTNARFDLDELRREIPNGGGRNNGCPLSYN